MMENMPTNLASAVAFWRRLAQKLKSKWGWVVAVATSLVFAVEYGFMYSFGLIMVEIMVEFGSSTTATGYVGTTTFGVSCIACLVVVPISDRLGYRWTAVAGVTLVAASCVVSSFAPNVWVMFFSHGLLYGLGVSLTMCAGINATISYFPSKHQSSATALASCGTNIGVLVFNPLVYLLITRYGWRNMMRIMSAVLFVIGIPCVLTLRNPTATRTSKERIADAENHPKALEATLASTAETEARDHMKNALTEHAHGEEPVRDERTPQAGRTVDDAHTHYDALQSESTAEATRLIISETEGVVPDGTLHERKPSAGTELGNSDTGADDVAFRYTLLCSSSDVTLPQPVSVITNHNNSNSGKNSVQACQDAAVVKVVHKASHDSDAQQHVDVMTTRGGKSILKCDGSYVSGGKGKSSQWESYARLLRMPDIWFLQTGLFLCAIALSFLYFSTVSVIVTAGFSKKMASLAMSVMGISEVFGKLALGFILDRLPIPKIIVLMAANCLGAVLILILSFVTTEWYIFVQVAVQGMIVMAALDSLPHSLSNQLFYKDLRTQIWAANMISMGVGGILAAAFGESVDKTGSYQSAFYGTIGIFIVSTLFLGSVVLYQGLFAKERYFVFKNVGRRYRAIESTDDWKFDEVEKKRAPSTEEDAESTFWRESTLYLVVDRETNV